MVSINAASTKQSKLGGRKQGHWIWKALRSAGFAYLMAVVVTYLVFTDDRIRAQIRRQRKRYEIRTTIAFHDVVRPLQESSNISLQRHTQALDPCTSDEVPEVNPLELLMIPETAAGLLEQVAARNNVTWSSCHWLSHLDDGSLCPPGKRHSYSYHPYWGVAQWNLPILYYTLSDRDHQQVVAHEMEKWYEHSDILVVVRNPYERAVQTWGYMVTLQPHGKLLNEKHRHSVAHMNQWWQETLKNRLKRYHSHRFGFRRKSKQSLQIQLDVDYLEHGAYLIPQVDYVRGLQSLSAHFHIGNIWVLRSEMLEHDWNCLTTRHYAENTKYQKWRIEGHKVEDWLQKHSTTHLTSADLEPETRKLIEQVYGEDFSRWKYGKV